MRFMNFRVAGAALAVCLLALAALAQNGGHGFDTSRMDTSASACTDFYQFANGNWLKTTQIPAAFPSWGSFNVLAENNRNTLHEILDEAAKDGSAKPGSVEQKIGDFYATCTDEARREAEGAKPLAPYLARVDALKDSKGLENEIARLHKEGIPVLFGFSSGADFKNSSMNIGSAEQGGLSLPNKDYYTKEDAESVKLREAFVRHVSAMFQLLGDAPAQADKEARTVMAMETQLAQNSRPPVELRDVEKQYHIMSSADLDKLTPHFSWEDFFAGLGLARTLRINMAHPEFFQAADKMLADVPLADWKTYLRWQLLNAAADALSSKFETENFNFYGKTLLGRKEQFPLWRRCVSATDDDLGEALGQEYVKRAFTPEAKQRMQAMVSNLLAAFRDRLVAADWMSDETRKAALAKLAAFGQKIGYPDKWIEYSRLDIKRDSYAANIIRASEFQQWRDLNKIGKPVDKGEWDMTPPTVNAYNNWQRNEIVFPAGILQPPFFNPAADDAINYGSIGAVLGPEINPRFADVGAKFDPAGNLQDWWAPADLKNFEGRADCIVKQFDAFEVAPGLHEQGKLVSGESIADLGGLTVAYHAFEKSLEGKPRPPAVDGFTQERRCFIAWAQGWAEKPTPEYERLIAQSNEHPLARFRVNAPLSNMKEFAQAFQCKAGDKMVRPDSDRCQIW